MARSLEKQPMIIPGKYNGLWTAYYVVIVFRNGNKSDRIELDEGVRGYNCKAQVTVDKNGWVCVE